jgi:hypothetical protein
MKYQHYIAAGVIASLCALSPAVRAQGAPPAPPAPGDAAEATGAAPGPGFVWMGGQWTSEAGQWKWLAAHWEQPPSTSAVWVAGHWVPSNGKWAWVNGAWSVQNAGQSQQVQPAYPVQTGVPMPSSPAPMVSGAYPEPAPDQQTVTTVYSPPDYSAEFDGTYPYYGYPYYAWSGYPWYWGYPGLAVGFGWGSGGWGHGYYHGGWGRGYGGWGRGYYHGGYAHEGGRGYSGHGSGFHGGYGGRSGSRH